MLNSGGVFPPFLQSFRVFTFGDKFNFENLYEFIKADDQSLKKLGINPSLKQEVAKYLND